MTTQTPLKTENLMQEENPKLSICIATYNRGNFIGETLDSILSQMQPGVELVVVDGASPDDTPEVMAKYLLRYPEIRYFREQENSGIDRDYDKAVGYAKGEFCWLMSDDDLLQTGAIDRVYSELNEVVELVVVNAEVRNADLSKVLVEQQLDIASDRIYAKNESAEFFAECMNYLSFIGCVVIRRETWLARDRTKYFGSLFVHVGVIFQSPPVENVSVISAPLIVIRYGNALWTARGFEIWSFMWPGLVWSFSSFSDGTKRRVCHSEPWKKAKTLFYYRAIGAYSAHEFTKFMVARTRGVNRLMARAISSFPAAVANGIAVLYFVVFNRSARMEQYDLLRSRHATWVSRFLGRFL
jgi:abequosyltransferase